MNGDGEALLAKAIGHPVRVGVLTSLCDGSALVAELVERLRVEPTVLSKHLAVLRDAGLVECEPEWRCRRYHLVHPAAVKELLAVLHRIQVTTGREATGENA